ncbi:MAG: HNH endonuclease signature motif containing protein [Ilumatobacteraceae bacterium]
MDTAQASLATAPVDSSVADPIDLTELPLERLEAELCSWSANLAAAEFRWMALLAEFDRREGWRQWECPSCVTWMCWQLSLDLRTAREKLRVARALVGLPLVSEQLRDGRLSYSKVRAITRIAEPANEAGLVAIALAGTTAQVERTVAAYRRVLPPGGAADDPCSDAAQWAKRGLHVRHNDDRTVTVTLTLPATLGMEVVSAVDQFLPPSTPSTDGVRDGLAARRADAAVALAGAALAATDEQLSSARPRYLVHVHTGEEQQEAHPDGRSDEMVVGVSEATAQRCECDADVETVVHDETGEVVAVSTRSSVIRGRLRRLVQQRDRTCRVPGCSLRARKEIHHLHHRGHGGTNDLDNLALVCAYHHHRLHEGGWHVRRLPNGSLEFTLPNGRVLPSETAGVDGDAQFVESFERDAADGRCRWEGDRLDLDWTLMTLFSQTPWHNPWHATWRHRTEPERFS